MKKIIKLMLAASAIFAASCANFQENEPENFNGQVFTASFENNDPQTKTRVDADDRLVTWLQSDVIGIVDKRNGNKAVKAVVQSRSDNNTHAVFTAQTSVSSPTFAVYPYVDSPTITTNSTGTQTACILEVPPEQTGKFEDAHIAAGYIDANGKIAFKNLAAIFKCTVSDANVRCIYVLCKNPIAGQVKLTHSLNNNTPGVGDGVNNDIICYANGLGTYYIAVRPESFAAGDIIIQYKTARGDVLYEISNPKDLILKAGDIVQWGNIADHCTNPGILPDGNTFNGYMKTLAGSLSNITWIQFAHNVSNPHGDIEIADDVYMSYVNGGINVSTSKNTYTANADCSGMFSGCYNVTSIRGLDFLDTSATTDMGDMFSDCAKLTSVNLTRYFTTANVTRMANMFYSCESLETLDLTNFDTRKVNNIGYMFEWCYNLGEIFLGPNFVIPWNCFTDEALLGCGATWYGTSVQMNNFITSLSESDYFSGSLRFAIDMGEAGWWSAWNIGADKPAQIGYYFSWGNDNGHWKNGVSDGYAFSDAEYKNTSGYKMITDWKYVPHWPSSIWRVPGEDDFKLLHKCCDVKEVLAGGIYAMQFTNKTNGNWILFPDCGIIHTGHDNSYHYLYWTREFQDGKASLYDVSNNQFCISIGRFLGLPVHPIARRGDVAVTGVSLDKSSLTLEINEKSQLNATVRPSNAFDKDVRWTSSNDAVASVSTTGTVKGLSEGTATITVTTSDGSMKAACNVTVVPNPYLLPGEFSVSETKKVRFSRGNLFYNRRTETWHFEENQFDFRTWPGDYSCIFGRINSDGTPADNIGLFYWSPSVSEAISENPPSDSKNFLDTLFTENHSLIPSLWRSLTRNEMIYLVSNRKKDTRGLGTVMGVSGLIILPDSFVDPRTNDGSKAFVPNEDDCDKNVYSFQSDWKEMEKNGAVFLPCAGYRQGTRACLPNKHGYIMSSDMVEYNNLNYYLLFRAAYVGIISRGQGSIAGSIRLVSDVE